jgi:hypothetical protein
MCLKFLLENNPANQALVSSLEAREVVPPPDKHDELSMRETLDKLGVDVRLGADGRARVERRDGYRFAQARRDRERMNAARDGGRWRYERSQGRVEELRDEVEALGLPVTDGGEGVGDENEAGSAKGKERAVEVDDEDDFEFM